MKIMRSRALMEANTSNRSLRHLESVRHKNKTIQSNMNNLLTITSLRSTLEELVNYATPSTPSTSKNLKSKNDMVSIQAKERHANGSTVVDISTKPPFFKLVPLSSHRSPLSKTPKHVIF
jgi:hypothetical protein